MHHIDFVEVEGFWDTYDFGLKLFPEVTFLIGQNGTGKTTLINLIAAALTADFVTLDRIPFKKISIRLVPLGKKAAPTIAVTKTRRTDRPFALIEYKVRPGPRGAAEAKYSLEDIEEQMFLRRYPDIRSRNNLYRRIPTGLSTDLEEIVHVDWISVHRASSNDRGREDWSQETAVDQRLEELSNKLVRFFATLSTHRDLAVRNFQESFFVTLVEPESTSDLFEFSALDKLEEFSQLMQIILDEMHVPKANIDSLIASFLDRGTAARKRLKGAGPGKPLRAEDAILLITLRRIETLVNRWKTLQQSLGEIFSPRDDFVKIANGLLQRKQMEITASYELQFKSRTGKILTPLMLSSGEKQLLILFGETVLQRGKQAIFIADEPELSLHVLWQEKLVESLRALNPAAQIIAATHSPDIVGPLTSHAIDMEKLIP